MTRTRMLLFAGLTLLPFAVQAQLLSPGIQKDDTDQRYCDRLGELYIRYVGRSETGPRTPVTPDVVGGTALAQCRAGNTAEAIPVLERKLLNARFTLPPRN
ncbi:MAG: hypothetical protein Q8K93_14370 [Reyranella sp.]|uniref:hypothetical protein n=1 Tax=Reyranella sp. TaxID=1929291 RepID=UPI00272F9BA2|nr:hypothetical protein [Reyranella sp.]MDP1963377.1 hypothetical protein [Reyranella sp.]MDP2376116.1 hypothetical protein [Reyranella sp.]